MLSAKWRPFFLSLSVLTRLSVVNQSLIGSQAPLMDNLGNGLEGWVKICPMSYMFVWYVINLKGTDS